MAQLPDPLDHRKADHPILPLFLKRWSPRAMTGEPLTEKELNTLLEAARWAPSTYNEQEWRYLYAHRDSKHWDAFFDLLVEANQQWCVNAGVLVLMAAHTVFAMNGKPNPVYCFDAGASFENPALQGAEMGLVVHGMAGFDRDKARTALKLPDDYEPLAMIALGRPGDPDKLPEALRERETVSGRRKISEFAAEGPFAFSE